MPISVPYSAPMSTDVVSTAWGITVLKAAMMPSIELPVIRPVPVDRMKKPMAVVIVPRTISEKGFFCKIRPMQAIRARKIAPWPKISLTMKFRMPSISDHSPSWFYSTELR